MLSYIFIVGIIILIYLALVVGFNLFSIRTNMLNFGYFAFYMLSAYSYAIINKYISDTLSVLLTLVLNIFVSILFFQLSWNLKGDVYIIKTFSLYMLLFVMVYSMESITGGPFGLKVGVNIIISPETALVPIFLLLLLSVYIYVIKAKGYFYMLECVKTRPIILDLNGYNKKFILMHIFILSTLFASVAGILTVITTSYVDPYMFSLDMFIIIFILAYIGNRSMSFTFIFTVAYAILDEILRNIHRLNPEIFYNLKMILIMLIFLGFLLNLYRRQDSYA